MSLCIKPSLSLWALIVLTQLNGQPVLVESSQIVVIRSQSSECGIGTGAVIRVGNSALCVKETPEQIREKIMEER